MVSEVVSSNLTIYFKNSIFNKVIFLFFQIMLSISKILELFNIYIVINNVSFFYLVLLIVVFHIGKKGTNLFLDKTIKNYTSFVWKERFFKADRFEIPYLLDKLLIKKYRVIFLQENFYKKSSKRGLFFKGVRKGMK